MKTTPLWNKRAFDQFASKCAHLPNLDDTTPAQVVTDYGAAVEIACPFGLYRASLSGSLRHRIDLGVAEAPAVGDFVAVGGITEDAPRVETTYPRLSGIVRRAADSRGIEQTLAANVSHALIVTTPPVDNAAGELDNYRRGRVERFLATRFGDIEAILVLNKIDLVNYRVNDLGQSLDRARSDFPNLEIVAVSAKTGLGIEELRALLPPEACVVLLGSSGCGKSSLTTRLTGEEIETTAVRTGDGRGRHTTTARTMFCLPGGAVIIDTPGLREVGLTGDVQADDLFADVVGMAQSCRFRDCAHDSEPGCAVREAVQTGELSAERVDAYREMVAESALTKRMRNEMRRIEGRRIAKAVRQIKKRGR